MQRSSILLLRGPRCLRRRGGFSSQRLKQQKELLEGLAELESICSNAATKSSDDLAKTRRRINEYDNAPEAADDEVAA